MANNGDIISFLKTKDYKMIDNALGKGSFGKTVLLLDPFIDELFVAKKYEPESTEIQEQFYGNFLDEIKILYKLNHKNIVRIYNYYAYGTIFTGFIIMEYISGKNIKEYFEDYCFDSPSPDDVFTQLIDGFQYIEEKGIIHRDIREGNILIDDSGIVKIIDFGLGKTFSPVEINDDSMVEIINRSGLDTLPNEFFTGIYDSQTDMFYLAELFNRILIDTKNTLLFSHQSILNKMKEKEKGQRFKTFLEIKESIGKKDFSSLDISIEDKEIYLNFSNAIYDNLTIYTSEKVFNRDVNDFIKKIGNVIEKNCFEDILPDNSALISTVVICGYRYKKNRHIDMSIIRDFYSWLSSLTEKSQELVLKNIIYKLSYIKEEIEDDQIPF